MAAPPQPAPMAMCANASNRALAQDFTPRLGGDEAGHSPP